jgi:hypothetical protein
MKGDDAGGKIVLPSRHTIQCISLVAGLFADNQGWRDSRNGIIPMIPKDRIVLLPSNLDSQGLVLATHC